MKKMIHVVIGLMLGVGLLSGVAFADAETPYYEVTIVNLTRGQAFTPFLVATHKPGVEIFALGEPASDELALLAEGGDTKPLADKLLSMPEVGYVETSEGLLDPGDSVTVTIPFLKSPGGIFNKVSLAAMLIPTDDAFIALNGVNGPIGKMTMYMAPAYDSGSSVNGEMCADIPGPVCGGTGWTPEDGEGYVHVHAGIHGIGDLDASEFDWRNPVAKVTIKRVVGS